MTADLEARTRRPRGDPAALAALLPDASRGREITRRELVTAMPRGSLGRPRSRRELMRAFHADPRLAAVKRADRRDHLMFTMQELARAACWEDAGPDLRATTRPTRARIARRIGYGLTTWKRCRRLLMAWGWLFLIRAGRSEEARLKSSAEDLQYEGNDAAVYGFAIPRLGDRWSKTSQKSGPVRPPAPASELSGPPMQGAVYRRGNPEPGVDKQEKTGLRPGSFPKPADLVEAAPGRGLEKLTERAVRASWRPFERALWSPAQWVWMVLHWPDGKPAITDDLRVRHPASWLRFRCSLWMDDHRRPFLPPALERRAAAAGRRSRRLRLIEAEHAEIAARLDPDPTDAAPHFEQLRAERGWRRPRPRS